MRYSEERCRYNAEIRPRCPHNSVVGARITWGELRQQMVWECMSCGMIFPTIPDPETRMAFITPETTA